MWSEGTLLIENTSVKYWVKALDKKSETYGIEGRKIIKMSLKVNGKWTLNYDRGWDIEPEDEASQLVYAFLMKKYG